MLTAAENIFYKKNVPELNQQIETMLNRLCERCFHIKQFFKLSVATFPSHLFPTRLMLGIAPKLFKGEFAFPNAKSHSNQRG